MRDDGRSGFGPGWRGCRIGYGGTSWGWGRPFDDTQGRAEAEFFDDLFVRFRSGQGLTGMGVWGILKELARHGWIFRFAR